VSSFSSCQLVQAYGSITATYRGESLAGYKKIKRRIEITCKKDRGNVNKHIIYRLNYNREGRKKSVKTNRGRKSRFIRGEEGVDLMTSRAWGQVLRAARGRPKSCAKNMGAYWPGEKASKT